MSCVICLAQLRRSVVEPTWHQCCRTSMPSKMFALRAGQLCSLETCNK